MGKCSSCNSWNTIIEAPKAARSSKKKGNKRADFSVGLQAVKPVLLSQVVARQTPRIKLADAEMNRVLGGGLVPGSLILLGGEPGIGKSTLMLQFMINFDGHVLYISGEENEEQIRLRADRLGGNNEGAWLFTETNVQSIIEHANETKPELLILDSIQTLYTPELDGVPGSVAQIKGCCSHIQAFAKRSKTPVFIIGHINKDGMLAGPKILEHMVDVVLQFEGDQQQLFRILRGHKNRFGSTNEAGIYLMQENGMQPVDNPSNLFMPEFESNLSGSAIAVVLKGIRPLLIEAQALVSPAVYGTAQRSSTGFDSKRLNMILAVLEKRQKLPFSQNDVFINIAGGIKLMDPAADLAVAAALISSMKDVPIKAQTCFAGEIGLNGEIRPVPHLQLRINEAERLGNRSMLFSHAQKRNSNAKEIHLKSLKTVHELIEHIL